MPAYSKTDPNSTSSDQSIPNRWINGFGTPLHPFSERLFEFISPLFLAVIRRRKKASRRAAKRKPNKSIKLRKRLLPRRAKEKKPSRKTRAPAKLRRGQQKTKSSTPPPKAIEAEEPLPPPVPPIGRAILLVPRDATYVDSLHPTFRWLSVGGATKYQVQWGEDPTLSMQYALVSLATEATIPVEKPLRVAGLYYWRVRGGNDAGWGPWSPVSSFHVLEETV